jgi:6-phosphogluconate dehydrogenase
MKNSQIGLIGLGVMGRNLSLNLERNGFQVAGYDIEPNKRNEFMLKTGGKEILTCNTVSELVDALEKPRRILMMVPAGVAVDAVIMELKPYLISGDLLMDGGNSHFSDTERRSRNLEEWGCHYMGVGVSGGEAGALWGPSIMPGGSIEGWQMIRSVLSAVAAKAEDGEPCVAYIGPRGAGHYVKMVHNGIEYGDMQLIAEVYDLLRRGLGMSAAELAELFADWNTTELKSYLIEITAEILRHIDLESGKPLVDLILDEAAQKGTGKWTSQSALDVGAPIPTINAAVESRIISSLKSQRVSASRVLHGPKPQYSGSRQRLLEAARQALYASKITSYAQGLGLLTIASAEYQYDFKLSEIAKIRRAGCIIRADHVRTREAS